MPHAKPRLYRDPVHDTIALEPDRPEGRLLIALIDTPEVQRLRRVRQLALSHLVYHGAEHSRFAHSLGVCWLARQMLDRLALSAPVPADERLVTLAAALLHDVGHAPFSHALEGLGGAHHEARSVALLRDPDTGVHRALAAVDPSLPGRVAARLEGTDGADAWLRAVVSSQLDADRLDYILRDGHMTGVRIGRYDLARVLAMLDVVDGHLGVHEGGQAAVEGYLLARFHMYQQVYLHKTSRAAERMLVAALGRATALRRGAGPLAWWPDGPLGRLLLGEPVDPVAFARLDDLDVWQALKRWAEEADRPLADLAGGLLTRRLWKARHLPADDDARAGELVAAARSVARVRGLDPESHVLDDVARDSPYQPFTGSGDSARSIRLIGPGGRYRFLEDVSEVVRMLGRLRHRQRLLCYHPELGAALARLLDRVPEGPAR